MENGFTVCGYVYDPVLDPVMVLAGYCLWLGDDWVCPDCGVGKRYV